MIDGATGALLAGGQGKRLGGVQKAFLRRDGQTLLDRTLGVFAPLFRRSILLATEKALYEGLGPRVIADPIPDRGAPGGLFAALSAVKTPWVFLAACDMPALDGRVIEALAARRRPGEAVIAQVDGYPEPLHAFWPREAGPVLESLLREGEPSFRDLLAKIPHVLVDISALEAEVPNARESFANVNTPEDLERFAITLPRVAR